MENRAQYALSLYCIRRKWSMMPFPLVSNIVWGIFLEIFFKLFAFAGPAGDKKTPYSLENIGNADEFALFFAAPPTRNVFTQSDKRNGSKISKQRVTGLAVVNATGSMKWKMLVIGKSTNPRGLSRVDPKTMPCSYRQQSKGWMTSDIWNDFLVEFDTEMRKTGRHFLLICDNFSGHAVKVELTHTKVLIEIGAKYNIFLVRPTDNLNC